MKIYINMRRWMTQCFEKIHFKKQSTSISATPPVKFPTYIVNFSVSIVNDIIFKLFRLFRDSMSNHLPIFLFWKLGFNTNKISTGK